MIDLAKYRQQARDMLQEFAQPLDGAAPAEVALANYARMQVQPEAVKLVDAAQELLASVDSLEQFRDKLIDLYHQSDPEGLAVAMAQLEALGTLSGRFDAKVEQ